jgi:hypothetical protein
MLFARQYTHGSSVVECFIPDPEHKHTVQFITDPDPNPASDPALILGKLNNKQMYCVQCIGPDFTQRRLVEE